MLSHCRDMMIYNTSGEKYLNTTYLTRNWYKIHILGNKWESIMERYHTSASFVLNLFYDCTLRFVCDDTLRWKKKIYTSTNKFKTEHSFKS